MISWKVVKDLVDNPSWIGHHLAQYADLYIRPIEVYRKVISNRKTGYDLFMLHIIYYTVLLFALVGARIAAVLLIAEVLLTIVPFTIYCGPYYLMNVGLRRKMKVNKLFRLLLVIKLQISPLLLILILMGHRFGIELGFVVYDNLSAVIFLLFILAMPIALRLSMYQRLLWIVLNYIATCFFVFGMMSVLASENATSRMLYQLPPSTPAQELEGFLSGYNNSAHLNIDNYAISIAEVTSDSLLKYDQFMLATSSMMNRILEQYEVVTRKMQKEGEVVLALESAASGTELDTMKIVRLMNEVDALPNPDLTLEEVRQYGVEFSEQYASDLDRVALYLSSTNFDMLRPMYQSLLDYMKQCQLYFNRRGDYKKLLDTSELVASVPVADGTYVLILRIDSTYCDMERIKYIEQHERINKYLKMSFMLPEYLFFPVEFLYDVIFDM